MTAEDKLNKIDKFLRYFRNSKPSDEDKNSLEVNLGSSLSSLLKKAINSQVDKGASRSDIIEKMASGAGIDAGTVGQIVNGEIKCPPMKRLAGLAKPLSSVSMSAIKNALKSDGCNQEQMSDQTEELELNLEKMKSLDGKVTFEAESFEEGVSVFVLAGKDFDHREPAPKGEYEMEKGLFLSVEEIGIIKSLSKTKKSEEMEDTKKEVEETKEVEKVEATKVTFSEEQTSEIKVLFSKFIEEVIENNEADELKLSIEERLAKLENLTEEVKLSEVDVNKTQPITHSPTKEVKGNRTLVMPLAKLKGQARINAMLQGIWEK